MSAAYACTIAARRNFSDGVMRPLAVLNSCGMIRNARIASAWETAAFAIVTARWISPRSSSLIVASRGRACCCARSRHQCWDASGSRVISAAMKGRLSPTTRHWEIRGCLSSRSSSTRGLTLLPPLVMSMSFLRPVMTRKPSSSSRPTSPVANHPSRSTDPVAAGSPR